MQKVDRLGWAAGVSVAPYGVPIGVRVNREEALPLLERALLPHWERRESPEVDSLFSLRVAEPSPRPGVRNYHLLYDGAARIGRSLELEEVLNTLEGALHLRVGATSSERIFVHAGAVGWKGRALLLPGRTHTGKSSLVRALAEAGATVYSDEYAVLDDQGRVYPYPRPMSLRDPARRVRVEEWGGGAHLPPLPVGMVVLTRFRPGGPFRPRRVTPGRAAMGLIANSLAAIIHPERMMAVLPRVATQAITLQGPRPEAADVAPRLLKRLERL